MQINRILKVKFDLSCPINPENNSDLDLCSLHLWSKFDDPSLNGRWVIMRTGSKLGKVLLLYTLKLNFTLKVKVNHPPPHHHPPPTTHHHHHHPPPPHPTSNKRDLNKGLYIYGPNYLVILAWTNDGFTIPEGQNFNMFKHVINYRIHNNVHTLQNNSDLVSW